MAFVPALISGLGALGGLFGNRSQTQKSTSQTQSNQFGNFNNSFAQGSSTTPQLNPNAQQLLEPLTGRYLEMLKQDPDLKGYGAGAVSDINHTSDIQQNKIKQDLANRGITSGPMYDAALRSADSDRFKNVIGLQNQLPLLAQQLKLNTAGQASDFFSRIPSGSYNEQSGGQQGVTNMFGNQSSQGTQTSPGNQLGGLFGSLGGILAQLYGMGSFGGSGSGGGSNKGYGPVQV